MNDTVASIFKHYCILDSIVVECDTPWEYLPICNLTYSYMFGSMMVAIGCGLFSVVCTVWIIKKCTH